MYGFWSTEIVGDFDPEEWFGFIYCIEHRQSGRRYIGRKQFRSRLRKKITGRKNRKVHIKDSNWKEYTSSCVELKEEIESQGPESYKFTIIKLCKTKRELGYSEVEEQFKRDVLNTLLPDGTRAYYNSNIMSRWFVKNDPHAPRPDVVEKNKQSAGQHWYNNGEIQIRSFTRPTGFIEGRLRGTVEKISRSNTGQKRSIKTRLLIGQKSKGRIPWNKDLTKETNQLIYDIGRKISSTMKGRPNPEHSKRMKGRVPWNKK